MGETTAIANRIVALRRNVARHKRVIKEAREALNHDAAELIELERQCQRLGMSLTIVPAEGVGGIHGLDSSPDPDSRSDDRSAAPCGAD